MAETTPLTRNKRPWALTFFGLLAAGGLIAMPFLAGPPDSSKMPDIVRFIGRFHPLLVHLPIGVFMLILLQELGAIFIRKNGDRVQTPVFPLFFGAASAIVAVLAGFLLYQSDGFEGVELAERHLWGGIAFAVVSVFVLISKAWTVATAGNPAFYRLLFFVSIGVMSFASHDGGSITRGEDYLFKYAPSPVRKAMGMPVKEKPEKSSGGEPAAAADPNAREVYADVIAPIFLQRCTECHKAEKAKGKLRMDTYEMLVKGGKEGPAIEAGSAEKSNIIVRMHLPLDEDEHMPPDGKPEPEAHEVALIKWWLDSGADPKKKISEMGEIPALVKEALAKLPASHAATSKAEAAKQPVGAGDDLKAQVATLAKEFPAAIAFESQDSGLVTFTAVSLRGNLDDAGFSKLSAVLPQLVTLDLSATKVTDSSVSKLAVAENLKSIRLAETAVTDASIETLVKLKNLESINLYGTKITDAGVAKLAEMPGLKRLYLWQTAVTPDAIAALKAKLPDCEVVTGI